jgi:hypothetical protein
MTAERCGETLACITLHDLFAERTATEPPKKGGAYLALGGVMTAIMAMDRRIGVPHRSWLLSSAFVSVFLRVRVIVQLRWHWVFLLWGHLAA